MRICTFHTNSKYEYIAKRMIESAERFGLTGKSVKKPHHGKWWENVNHKPAVILDALKANSGQPLLYIDADAIVDAAPTIFDNCDADIAAHFEAPNKPCGGTLWFSGGKRSVALVEAWINEIAKAPKQPDDAVNLGTAIRQVSGLRVLHLPPAYLWHETTMRRRFPTAKPVIRHFCVGDHHYEI